MADSYIVSDLASFTNQDTQPLIKETMIGLPTYNFVSHRMDAKSDLYNLNTVTALPHAQAPSCNTWNSSGSTTYGAVTATVKSIAFYQNFCNETMRQKWVSMHLEGIDNSTIPFETEVLAENAAAVQGVLDTLFWQGDTDNADDNLNRIDGIFIQVSASAETIVPTMFTASVLTPSLSNIDTIVYGMTNGMTKDIRQAKDLNLYMSSANYDLLLQKLFTSYGNLGYNADTKMTETSFRIPGTRVNAVSLYGIEGDNRMILTPKENIYMLGVYDDPSMVGVDAFYDRGQNTYKTTMLTRLGAKIVFPGKVVANYPGV